MYKIGLKLWSTNACNYLYEAQKLYNQGVYDYIELYVVPDTLDTLKQWRALDIPFIIHNAHFAHGFNLANKDFKKRNRIIYTQSEHFADALDARYIIFHGGIDGDIHETAEQLASLHDTRALIENKPFVALPNKMGGEFCRGSTLVELMLVMECARCGFCLDFGHAVCSSVSQGIDPYLFIEQLLGLKPNMYHLSDVVDMGSVYDAHPHLGMGNLNLTLIKHKILPQDAMVSIETIKDSPNNLDDFIKDVEFLRNV